MNRSPRDDVHGQDELSPFLERLAALSRAVDRGIIRAHRWATAPPQRRRRARSRRVVPPVSVDIPGPREPMRPTVDQSTERG
jgi:aryl-alcohol dehydrogenase-like predicted oxidoreductase